MDEIRCSKIMTWVMWLLAGITMWLFIWLVIEIAQFYMGDS